MNLPLRQRNPVLDTLASSFKAFQDCLPLAVGIHKVIKQRLPDIDAAQLKTALKMHTGSTRYLKALTHAETRFDLDGAPAGAITPEQRKQARDTLRERYEKIAERKKAEQEAQQRQENLLKLVEKFKTR
ncbi:MAG: ProQ/FinO family protein [Sterolibacterium sp.]